MGLRRFLLDVTIGDIGNNGQKEEYFFYRENNNRLHGWIVRQRNSLCSMLKAFKEDREGIMTLQDLRQPELPIRIIGVESNGCLLASTGEGLLRYRCQNSKITERAVTRDKYESQHLRLDVDNTRSQSLFPGMQVTDHLSCGNLELSRHETVAQGFYGEEFFLEALLLVRSKCANKSAETAIQWIAIGNSQIDNNLNLVNCLNKQLLDIPVLNYIVDNPTLGGALRLIGWNRSAMQSIRIEESTDRQQLITTQRSDVMRLDNCMLEDASKPCIDNGCRIAAWRDRLNPGTFYYWQHED